MEGEQVIVKVTEPTDWVNSAVIMHKKHGRLRVCLDPRDQNGTAERQWRSLFDMARCILLDKGLPKYMWPYAVSYAAYTRNRCYVEGKSRLKLL